MSYIVKSRDFPKSCNECDEPHLCCDFYYCGVGHQKDGRHLDVDEHYLNKTKHPDCPLSELPKKHGRLIDADYLINVLQDTIDNYPDNSNDGNAVEKLVVNVCKQYIEHCPTVIKAEVSE